jgi:transposase
MEVLYPRCAGLDVHKDLVVACARIARGREVRRELAEFGTTSREVLRLVEWLAARKVTHVAMESTGVYWKPVWHLLEGHFQLILGNSKQMRHVPGRKSDQVDASWIADLLAHGLVKPSFVPPPAIQELRDLTRTRKQLIRERARHVQRVQKTLDAVNVKISSVLTDIMGVSGRRILAAILEGEENPQRLAALAHPSVKTPREKIAEALSGRITQHHRFMLGLHLRQIDALDEEVRGLEARIERLLEPFRPLVENLCTMPGVKKDAAAAILAEIGTDMSVFPNDDHLVSWSGISPGLNESAGKKKGSRTKRQRWLKATMTQCAWAATHKRDSFLSARYYRIRSRRGKTKAVLAVANSMLRAIYHMIEQGVSFHDLGPDYFDRQYKERNAHRLLRRLESLGYQVELRTAA